MHEGGKRRVAALSCLLVAGLVLAACGGGSSHSAGASTGPTTTTTNAGGPGGRGGFGAALTAFRSCMSGYGITLSIPTRRPGGGNGGPPSTTPGDTRPRGGAGGFGFGGGGFANRFNTPPAGVDPTKYKTALAACKSKLPTGGGLPNNSAFTAYRSCLSDHGVTLPANGGGAGIDRNSATVKAALKTCAPLLPAGGFRRGGTTTTTVPAA